MPAPRQPSAGGGFKKGGCSLGKTGGQALVKVIVSMYLLDLEAACIPTAWTGVTAQPRGASMRNEIIQYAHALFPKLETIQALEMLLLLVYATLDSVIFAEEDAKQYPVEDYEEDPETTEVWDYVY